MLDSLFKVTNKILLKRPNSQEKTPVPLSGSGMTKLPLLKLNFPLLPGAPGTFSAPMTRGLLKKACSTRSVTPAIYHFSNVLKQ